jgi:hypothetical protein
MKYLITVLFGLMLSIGHGQTVYTSTVTENFTTQQVEQIDRTITIGEKFIVIQTVIDSSSSDIQQLEIKEIIRNYDMSAPNRTYSCRSLDGKYPTLIIVYLAEKVEEIHAIQPNINNDANERYRFLIY